MELDTGNPKSFYLSSEKNKEIFEQVIIPKETQKYDFSPMKNPTVYLTGGLPGAGKSSMVDSMINESGNSNIFIANSDRMRPYHEHYAMALKAFGSNAGAAIHRDATIFSEKLLAYVQGKKADFIIDGTLKDPEKADKLISSLQKNNYTIKVTMLAVNEYESLQGVYNRYAEQYQDNPTSARFVDPKFIKIGKPAIEETAKILFEKNIHEFKIKNRDHELIYDYKRDIDKSPSEVIKYHTDLKNWSNEKLDTLNKNFEKVVNKLEEVKAPKNIIDSAKLNHGRLNSEIKNIKAERTTHKDLYKKIKSFCKERDAKQNTQSIQKSKGLER